MKELQIGCAFEDALQSTRNCHQQQMLNHNFCQNITNSIYWQARHVIYESSVCCNYRYLETVGSTPTHMMLQSHKVHVLLRLAEKGKLGTTSAWIGDISIRTRKTRETDHVGCMRIVQFDNVVVNQQWHQIRQSTRSQRGHTQARRHMRT